MSRGLDHTMITPNDIRVESYITQAWLMKGRQLQVLRAVEALGGKACTHEIYELMRKVFPKLRESSLTDPILKLRWRCALLDSNRGARVTTCKHSDANHCRYELTDKGRTELEQRRAEAVKTALPALADSAIKVADAKMKLAAAAHDAKCASEGRFHEMGGRKV